MNNEIGRKITSLTLMTIMLAGGMSFAAPSVMPAAFAANANLFVSAENSQFDNYMSGPQVIEVVVIDSDINDTDQGKGEPDVTVNGKKLRMAQAVDGNWYGYFADKKQAIAADGTVGAVEGVGLDFGTIVTPAEAKTATGVNFGDTTGVAIQRAAVNATAGSPDPNILNVVREAKDLNANTAANGGGPTVGQIGVDEAGEWPFIQLYTFTVGGNVIVQYNKGGGAQSATLTFDTVDQFASASLDRAVYPQGSQVHATITDLWLNIDPTDEDSWTFGTTGTGSTATATTNYQVFDENGLAVGDIPSNTDTNTLTASLSTLMCENNCRLITNADVQKKGNVITLQDNDDSAIQSTGDSQNPLTWETEASNISGKVPVTITEQGPNSGVFGTYDESDTSNIIITNNAKRGTSASVDYNETPVTILVGHSFASVDIQPTDDEWNSGEEIPIVIIDGDANKNSRADEDLDLNNPSVTLIPSLKTGAPNTLSGVDNGGFTAALNNTTPGTSFQKFSDRGIITIGANTTVANGEDLTLTFGTMANVFGSTPINDADFHGFALFNYDVRSLNNKDTLHVNTVDISLAGVTIGTGEPLQGLILLNGTAFKALSPATALTANFTLNTSATGFVDSGVQLPVVADIFGFGFLNDGLEADERIANQIIRIEAEETGDNTSTFAGSLEYTMINQLNINDAETYTGLSTIANDPSFIVIEDLTDEDSPRVNYNDLGADGVITQVADQEEAPSHSGIVSFDQRSYKNADTVTITLEDLDLNVDSDLIDIYTVVTVAEDANQDAVGSPGVANGGTSIHLANGDELGRLLDVEFNDNRWTTPAAGSCLTALTAITSDTGLGATGFTLIETGTETGVFLGDFQIPGAYCPSATASAVSVTGLDIKVSYVDFRDASGEVIEVGDSAGVRANTGSVSLDRTVYPVPFGIPDRFATTDSTTPSGRSIFPIHQTGITPNVALSAGEYLEKGGLTVHVRVNDPDFDTSASGEDKIAQNNAALPVGPVKLSIIRGASQVVLGYAGGPSAVPGPINVGNTIVGDHKIAISELSIPANNNGFISGETINILQSGATTTATGLFTNGAVGVVQATELTITSNVNGQTSPLNITIQDGVNPPVSAIFTDLNGDTNVDTNEIGKIGTGALNNGAVTIRDPANNVIANAVFTDDVDTIDNGELTITSSGAGYNSGSVTLVGVTSTASVTAIFSDAPIARQFGPMNEIAPDAGIFESDILIRYTDGPASSICPPTTDFVAINGNADTAANPVTDRFNVAAASGTNYCILQGDILQVEYTDPTDASGDVNTVTDSATFDLRNGVLQSDKSVYIIGSDMILTLIEPDLDLDNDQAETYDLDLIEWDSDAKTLTMGNAGGESAAFDPEPLNFRETGDSTGIFQIVVEIPSKLGVDQLKRGEQVVLEYTDWGPSGSDFVGDESEDVNLTIFTSNFGATVELDQKVYTWTDKVYITIVAPDHNFDSNLVDEIGDTAQDPIKVSTRGHKLSQYKLVETGTDTGIFTGEVILTGFTHDADGKSSTGDPVTGSDVNPRTTGSGPTSGYIEADDDDGITVSFEFSEDETVVGSALIRWNIGEVQWLEASYPASGTGVVRVIDPDMNLDPEAVDNFDVDAWSDSDAGGIDLTVTETNEATGIFEGTVFFTTTDESSGHRLRVSEGDTVTANYQDNTLPSPYTTADELDITATSLIGTVVPPLERAPAANLRTVDAFGNSLDTVSVDQQVQISADLANGQDREQQFAYLVQIQDGNGVTVSLAWITGSLSAGQSFSPALSWIPTEAGTYSATAFVWESVDNPTALSPPVSTTITVR